MRTVNEIAAALKNNQQVTEEELCHAGQLLSGVVEGHINSISTESRITGKVQVSSSCEVDGCVHNNVSGKDALVEYIKAKEIKPVCEKRMKFLSARVRNFRSFMENQSWFKNKSFIDYMYKVREEVLSAWDNHTGALDEFTWTPNREDSLVDINQGKETINSRLDNEINNKDLFIAMNVADKAVSDIWNERSEELFEKGMTWLNNIDDSIPYDNWKDGKPGQKFLSLINKFKGQVNKLRSNRGKSREITYQQWAALTNYANELAKINKVYPCELTQGCTSEEVGQE